MSLNPAKFSRAWQLILMAIGWLLLVAALHIWLNMDHGSRKVIKMGYMPVITNLAAPIMDHVSKQGDGVRYKAIKFASFAEMADALRNDQIDVGFMIAPLPIVLHQQGENVKIIYIGNRNESTLVARKGLEVKSIRDLAGKTVAVPMRYSGHNLSILKLIEDNDLEGQVNVVEMNPPDMASALSAGSLDAYYVGEPFAAQTLKSGDAELVLYAETVWEQFITNLVIVRQDMIDNDASGVQQLTEAAIRSGLWAENNLDEAAVIAADYWNQPLDLVKYALNTPKSRVLFDSYTPKEDEIQLIADLMQRFNLIKNADITGLVDDRFAKQSNLSDIDGLQSILRN